MIATYLHGETEGPARRAVRSHAVSRAIAYSAVPALQKKGSEEEELQMKPVAQLAKPEREALTMKSAGQLKSETVRGLIQRKDATPLPGTNQTGMPDNLKTGIENLSGFSMDDMKGYDNSAQPERLNALAYAQGADIHISSGQERHLPHDAWHVVQQKQGPVRTTIKTEGVAINDDKGLEKEAGVMGAESIKNPVQYKLGQKINSIGNKSKPVLSLNRAAPVQGYFSGTLFGLPEDNRISERAGALLAGKQELYANREVIESGNKAFGEKGTVRLLAGEQYQEANSLTNITLGAGLPLFAVIPSYEQKKGTIVDPMMKVINQANPSMNDTEKQRGIKSRTYEAFVMDRMNELEKLEEQSLSFIGEKILPGMKENDTGNTSVHLSIYAMFKSEILDVWMRENQIAAKYIDEARLHITYEPGEDAPPSLKDFSDFIVEIRNMRLRTTHAELDRAKQNRLILPTDCFTAALAIGATHTKNKANPDVGQTHFVDLGSETGWQNHWATVMMKDGMDNITLENAAGTEKAPMDRSTWWFGMYGTRKKEQSFEEEYKALNKERTSGMKNKLAEINSARNGYIQILD